MSNKDDMTRRSFLHQAAAGALALGAAGAVGGEAAEDDAGKMPMRTLGKTGVRVSLLGFGGGSRFLLAGENAAGEDEATQMMERAIGAGITYFDTAAAYGRDRKSERFFGRVLSSHRKRIFLATKTGDRTHDGAMRSVEESLKLLRTDHLDLIQMHDIGPRDDPTAWEKPGGALTALRKLKDQKVVRFIGFTGHQKAEVHKKVIESLEWDTVLMALNAAGYKPFRETALPAAREKSLGIIGMKVTRGLVGVGANKASARELLAYVWDLPIATVIVGMEDLNMLNENIRLARSYKPGQVNTASLAARLAPRVTAEQLGWAVPGYKDAFA